MMSRTGSPVPLWSHQIRASGRQANGMASLSRLVTSHRSLTIGRQRQRRCLLTQSVRHPQGCQSILARITHAGYHEPSARDAHRRIIAFFDAHLKRDVAPGDIRAD